MPRNCRLTLRMLAACTLGGEHRHLESSRAMRDAGISPAVRERLSCRRGSRCGGIAAGPDFVERLRHYRSHITLICVWGYALVAGSPR